MDTTYQSAQEFMQVMTIPQLTPLQTWVSFIFMLAIIIYMMVATPTIQWLVNYSERKLRNDPTLEVPLSNRVEIALSGDIGAPIGAVLLSLILVYFFNCDFEVIKYKFLEVPWHEVLLVSGIMFQSLQQGRITTHILAWLQKLTSKKVDGEYHINERKFSALAIPSLGLLSSLFTEVGMGSLTVIPFFKVNENQSMEVKKRLVILLETSIGIGGGLTKFAAPPIVIAAKIFGWSHLETFMYLAPFVLSVLVYIGYQTYKCTDETVDATPIKTKPIWKIDIINAILWVVFLYVGAFFHGNFTIDLTDYFEGVKGNIGPMFLMMLTLVVSFFINLGHIFFREPRKDDGKKHKVPMFHLCHQAFESKLVFLLLAGLLFLGVMSSGIFVIFGQLLPQNEFIKIFVLYLTTDVGSAFMDNALAVLQLAPLAKLCGDFAVIAAIAIAIASLIGGIVTVFGNAVNVVIFNTLKRTKEITPIKMGYFEWTCRSFGLWFKLTMGGIVYIMIAATFVKFVI